MFLRKITFNALNCLLRKNNPTFIKHSSNLYKDYIKVRCLSSAQTQKDVLIDNNKISNRSNYTTRSCTCGELNIEHVGQKVTLCGWLEYQRLNKFLVLRDGYGQTQLICNDDIDISKLNFESIIQVEGKVVARPADMVNKRQSTGEIEINIHSLKVLNPATEDLPFNIRGFQKAKEALRMQYRYLDMRFPEMQRNMRVRSDLIMEMRHFLCKKAHFVDVETPTLFKATPGGAQEFIVPTRFPGLFYTLVQSPQQFKQMLMAGAIDRYFQIARCYRDEGSRPDRQPEFTQLDIEMSFTNCNGVQSLIEDLLNYSWPEFLPKIPSQFPRMSYDYAMENYGCDKPDTRFDFKLQNCSNLFSSLQQKSDVKIPCAYYLLFDKPLNTLTNKFKENMSILAKSYQCKFVQMKLPNKEKWIEKMTNLLGAQLSNDVWEQLKLNENSVLFLAFGEKKHVLPLLGKVRLDYVNDLESKGAKIINKSMNMLWVTDFPLFEEDNEGKLCSAHHPFTAPQEEDMHLLESSPLKVRAQAYDLVLNGNEIGGGSIRIHNPLLQEYVLKLLNINTDYMQHMIEMLKSGCPPHGGIALGLDRLLAIILNTTSIRDVIAFPKTADGKDPVSGAPSPVTEEDKKLYHIQTKT